MKLTKIAMATLVVGLLTLNGCMLKHLINSDDEESMGMHDQMQHEMGMGSMMSMDEDDTEDEAASVQ